MTFNGIKASNYGFEKYTSGCFLTTATVKYMGKPDDCYELTVLRDFRDKYMLTDSINLDLMLLLLLIIVKIEMKFYRISMITW